MNGLVEGNWLRTALAAMAMAFAAAPQAVGASDSFDQTHGQFDRLLRARVHGGQSTMRSCTRSHRSLRSTALRSAESMPERWRSSRANSVAAHRRTHRGS